MSTHIALPLVTLCLLATYVTPANAQDSTENPNRTLDSFNGREWQHMSKLEKNYYVAGLVDGMSALLGELPPGSGVGSTGEEALRKMYIDGLRLGEIVTEIDSFFVQPANARLTIPMAYKYAIMKFKGADRTKLEQYVEFFRRAVNR